MGEKRQYGTKNLVLYRTNFVLLLEEPHKARELNPEFPGIIDFAC